MAGKHYAYRVHWLTEIAWRYQDFPNKQDALAHASNCLRTCVEVKMQRVAK